MYKNDFGFTKLLEVDFIWEKDRVYDVNLICKGELIEFFVNEEKILEIKDSTYTYGMYGFARCGVGRTLFGNVFLEEI